MLNDFPAFKVIRGQWTAEVFENVNVQEPHICIYKGPRGNPEFAPWEPVQKFFLQMKAEGFFDRYKGKTLWIGSPKQRTDTNGINFHFVAAHLNDETDEFGDLSEC